MPVVRSSMPGSRILKMRSRRRFSFGIASVLFCCLLLPVEWTSLSPAAHFSDGKYYSVGFAGATTVVSTTSPSEEDSATLHPERKLQNAAETKLSFNQILVRACSKGLGGGIPGAIAGVIQVLTLMGFRTIINYQMRYGTTFAKAFDLLYKVHDNDSALVEFQKSLAIRESILGKDHRDTGKTYCFVGHALREKRDYDEAVCQYRRALRVLVTLLGRDYNHTKDVISCIDDVLKAKGLNDQEASKYMATLLKSLELKNSGDAALQEGNTAVAIGAYKKALMVEEIPLGRNHPDTGDIYSLIGDSLAKQGELKAASVEYGNALAIYASTLGGDHPDTKEALDNIQNVRMGRLKTFTQVVGAFKSNLG